LRFQFHGIIKRPINDTFQTDGIWYHLNIGNDLLILCYADTTLNDPKESADMSRTFLYCRVSTTNQFTENQVQEVKGAGFDVQPGRVAEEIISGSIAAKERPGFQKLLERMESGDVLIVTKLDRLGRNAMDVRQTVEHLAATGIRVHCLALGGVDLTSPAGKMTMQVLGAVAEFERDLLIERTQQGLKRAKAEGKRLGRPEAVDTTAAVQRVKAQNKTQLQVAAELGIGIATVKRHWNKG
jgi:putative DNA-invertase from lambdoid prophage Rac